MASSTVRRILFFQDPHSFAAIISLHEGFDIVVTCYITLLVKLHDIVGALKNLSSLNGSHCVSHNDIWRKVVYYVLDIITFPPVHLSCWERKICILAIHTCKL